MSAAMSNNSVASVSAVVSVSATDSIIGTLVGLYPESSPKALRQLVDEQLARFVGAKVTTFIPVLVLRGCREALAAVSMPRAPNWMPLASV
jgi:hypothetical protein